MPLAHNVIKYEPEAPSKPHLAFSISPKAELTFTMDLSDFDSLSMTSQADVMDTQTRKST